jgi:hypothetical protein
VPVKSGAFAVPSIILVRKARFVPVSISALPLTAFSQARTYIAAHVF